jgi:type VI secretion system protein ImpK
MQNDYPRQIDKICAEIIVGVMDASKSPSAADPGDLYRELCAKFDAAIRLCEVERFPVDTVRELLYPIAALTDEVFMGVPQYRNRWIANPLQLRYFGEMDAGAAFFTRLKKLTDAPEGKEHLIELYFICLALGFKGMYGMEGQSGLRVLFEDVGTILTDMRLNRRGASALTSGGGAKKRFLSLRNGMIAIFSLLMVAATVVYLSSLVDFLKFLENFV